MIQKIRRTASIPANIVLALKIVSDYQDCKRIVLD